MILVRDLASATGDFERRGFTVTPGGAHAAGPFANALVAFEDSTYLELLAFRRRAPADLLHALRRLRLLRLIEGGRSAFERRFVRRTAASEGLADFALRPDAMGDTVASARTRGLEVSDALPGERARPDGQIVRWLAAVPAGLDLPFLCADVTPRALRVPEGAARRHANGATGVVGVIVAVRDLEASVTRYRALVMDGGIVLLARRADAIPNLFDAAAPGAAAPSSHAPVTTIMLVEPRAGGEIAARLRARGEGPCAIVVRTAAGGEILVS